MSEQKKWMGAQSAPIQTNDDGHSGQPLNHVYTYYSDKRPPVKTEPLNLLIDQAFERELRAYARADVCAALGHHDLAARWDARAERHARIRRALEAAAWEVAS